MYNSSYVPSRGPTHAPCASSTVLERNRRRTVVNLIRLKLSNCAWTAMALKLVECVPNFSEGRLKSVIDAIAAAISGTQGCSLLDVDPGESTNRTVYTFVGDPVAVVEGAVRATKVAADLIDMRKHKGEHPRLGAMDVCPFIPVRNVTMEECIKCSWICGRRLAEELNVPVYLYAHAAKEEHRKSLAQIRQGEYEGLAEKIKKAEWKPDFGESEFVPKFGACVVGARPFLIAFNMNILGTKEQAHRIALDVRETGRSPTEPGLLKTVQAIGWEVKEIGSAQVSMNLHDFHTTPMHTAFETVVSIAKGIRVGVCGSEVVGMLPLEALMMTAKYYIEKEGLFILEQDQMIKLAIDRLGLNSVKPFDPKKRIIEFMIDNQEKKEPLSSLTLRQFILSLGQRSATPGGGSAAAAVAAMGAALGTMAGLLTYGIRKYESVDPLMRQLIPPFYSAMMALIPLVDLDSASFENLLAARKLPTSTAEEKAIAAAAVDKAQRETIEVPLETMRCAYNCLIHLEKLAETINPNCKSDLMVGMKSLETGIFGAYCNVQINLDSLSDELFKAEVSEEAEIIMASTKDIISKALVIIQGRK